MSVHQQNALEFGIWSKSLYQKDQHVLKIWLRTYSIYRLWETDYLTNSLSFHGVMSWLFILLPNGHLGQYTQRRYLQKVSSQLCALLQCKSTNSRGDVGIDYCISVLQCLLDLLQRSTLFGVNCIDNRDNDWFMELTQQTEFCKQYIRIMIKAAHSVTYSGAPCIKDVQLSNEVLSK